MAQKIPTSFMDGPYCLVCLHYIHYALVSAVFSIANQVVEFKTWKHNFELFIQLLLLFCFTF